MKLVFPRGEHPQVLLGQGVNRLGSDPGAHIVINRAGVQPQHCLLNVTATGVMLDVPHGADVSVNGRPVDGLIALRPGDTIGLDGIEARLAAVDTANAAARRSENDNVGVTAVRAALPRYVLRAVIGEGFGRNHPLTGPTTVGRAPESTLRLDETGISRQHARIVPSDDGVIVEDLNSTNGTYINGKRILRETAQVGDEISFDTLRFRLAASARAEAAVDDADEDARRRPLVWIVVAAAVLALGIVGTALMRAVG